MTYLLKLKMFICKLFTCWMPPKMRKKARNILFWFSLKDYFRFKNQNFHVVSLGNNCLPRVLTTAVKIKPREFYGEKTMPFDFCNSHIDEIIDNIQCDFKHFFDFEEIDTEIKFLHDYMLTPEQFYQRYTKRIQNFRGVINSDKMVYFIYSNFDNPDIKNLYEVLKQKRGEKPFKLICLNAQKIDNPNIIQITRDFHIDHREWVQSFMNQYKDKNDKYTKYCQDVGKELKEIIKEKP